MRVLGMPEQPYTYGGVQTPSYSDTLNVGGVSIGGGYSNTATTPTPIMSIFGDTRPQIQDINLINGAVQKQPIEILNSVMDLVIAFMPYLNLVDDKVQRALRNYADKYAAGKLNIAGVPSDLTDIVAHIINSTARILAADENTIPLLDNFVERLGEYSKSVPVVHNKKSKYYDTKTADIGANLHSDDNMLLNEFLKYVKTNNIVVPSYSKFNKYMKEMMKSSNNKAIANAFNKADTVKLFNTFVKMRG